MAETQEIVGKHEQAQVGVSNIIQLQYQMARERPRDQEKAVKSALAELRLFPEFAMKAYYSIPYKNNKTGRVEPVEGASIKAAMAMARNWGNCLTACQVGDERDDRVICQGAFFDFETGHQERAEVEVMRHFRSRDGKLIRRDANMMHMAIQATLSKAKRNAAINALPTGFVNLYFAEAKRLVALPKVGADGKVVSIQERILEGKNKLAQHFGGTPAEIEMLISAAVAEADGNWSFEKELAYIVGLWNGLKGGADPDMVFLREKKSAPGNDMPLSTDDAADQQD